jgi:hypothetical protein
MAFTNINLFQATKSYYKNNNEKLFFNNFYNLVFGPGATADQTTITLIRSIKLENPCHLSGYFFKYDYSFSLVDLVGGFINPFFNRNSNPFQLQINQISYIGFSGNKLDLTQQGIIQQQDLINQYENDVAVSIKIYDGLLGEYWLPIDLSFPNQNYYLNILHSFQYLDDYLISSEYFLNYIQNFVTTPLVQGQFGQSIINEYLFGEIMP